MSKPDIITALATRWRAGEHQHQADRLSMAIDQAIELRTALEELATDAADGRIALSHARGGVDRALTWLFAIADKEGLIADREGLL